MVKIKEAILVEGRYDKNTLSQIVDAPILETAGFGIFKDKKQMALLRRVAESRGLIVFTDPDGAGFVIRNHIKSAIPGKYLKHAYIPDIYGKETYNSLVEKIESYAREKGVYVNCYQSNHEGDIVDAQVVGTDKESVHGALSDRSVPIQTRDV